MSSPYVTFWHQHVLCCLGMGLTFGFQSHSNLPCTGNARSAKAPKQASNTGQVDDALIQIRRQLPAFGQRQELLDTVATSQARRTGHTTALPV